MFGGCPKWESGKSHDALPKLAKTTVLELGELSTNFLGCLVAVFSRMLEL